MKEETRIIKLRNKELSEINNKIQENKSLTKEELNKLWGEFIKN